MTSVQVHGETRANARKTLKRRFEVKIVNTFGERLHFRRCQNGDETSLCLLESISSFAIIGFEKLLKSSERRLESARFARRSV